MSILVPGKILSRFHIAQSLHEVEKWIAPEAIPIGYGGKRVVEGADLPTGCNRPTEYGKGDYLVSGAGRKLQFNKALKMAFVGANFAIYHRRMEWCGRDLEWAK